MSVVPRVLLDHVDEDPAHGHDVALPLSTTVIERVRGDGPARSFALIVPGRERLVHVSGVDIVELAIRIGFRRIDHWYVLHCQRPSEPSPLDISHMADQTQE